MEYHWCHRLLFVLGVVIVDEVGRKRARTSRPRVAADFGCLVSLDDVETDTKQVQDSASDVDVACALDPDLRIDDQRAARRGNALPTPAKAMSTTDTSLWKVVVLVAGTLFAMLMATLAPSPLRNRLRRLRVRRKGNHD